MEFRIYTEPQQGARYGELLRVAQVAEALGFSGFFRSDHYVPIELPEATLPGPTDAWITLAALARETERIRLGTLMTSATFRLPGPLAVAVAQTDEMSGGRVEIGLGAGWYLEEHRRLGIPFPPLRERFERLEEQVNILSSWWTTPVGETFTFHGRYYSLAECPALPKPLQVPGPPIIVGGRGLRKTPALAARYASEFNLVYADVEDIETAFAALDRALDDHGRDRSSIVRSVGLVCCCGRSDDEVAERERAIRARGTRLRGMWLRGSPGDVVGQVNRLREMGVSRMYLQILDLADLDHLRLIADEVVMANDPRETDVEVTPPAAGGRADVGEGGR
jgi:F420-dependent oxidoreductase-like protein